MKGREVNMSLSVERLFNLEESNVSIIFEKVKYPWEALPKIKSTLIELSKSLPDDFKRIDEFIWVGKGTTIDKNVLIKGPAIIGYDCEIRNSAYIRENVIIGNNVVVGNSSEIEIKNSILFNKVQVPHFNYVGDSILGYKAHLGAGVILSNLKSDGTMVRVKMDSNYIETGLRKFGALIGDYVEIGSNSVLNPGTIIGKESIIYPLTSVRGFIAERHIVKGNGEIVQKRYMGY